MYESIIIKYAFMFFLFGAIGWTIETIYRTLAKMTVINAGFLHGPICPIYGCGVLAFEVTIAPIARGHSFMERAWLVIIAGMLVADVVEYLTSFIMEKLFHMRWWDYTGKLLNINGRVCLRHTCYWGIFALAYTYIISPLFNYWTGFFSSKIIFYATVAIIAVFILDLILTVRELTNLKQLLIKLEALKNAVLSVSKSKTELGRTPDFGTEITGIRDSFTGLQAKDAQKREAGEAGRLLRRSQALRNIIEKNIGEIENAFNEIKDAITDYDDEKM